MQRMYPEDKVSQRIKELGIENRNKEVSPGFWVSMSDKKYRKATFVACILSLFQ